MSADKIRNRDAGEYVRRRESFTGSNLYGQWRSNELGVHRTQAHPHEETIPMDTKTMDTLARYGMGGVAVMR